MAGDLFFQTLITCSANPRFHSLFSADFCSRPNDPSKKDEDYFFIECSNKYEKISFEDILYVEGMQNYVNIYTQKGKFVTMFSLKNLEENLDQRSFIRVHKSYIVAVNKIDGIESNEIFIQTGRIPISRNYRQQVIEKVISKRLWEKK